MKKSRLLSSLFCTGLLFSNALLAESGHNDQHYNSLSWLLTGGYDFGGDKLLEIEYTDGTSDTLRTGQGFNVGIGSELYPDGMENFSIRGTVGFKYDSNRESDVDASLYSFPIELSVNWMPTRNWRFGLGHVEHLNPQFKSDFGDARFDDSSGPKYEIAYNGFALSYTDLEYVDQFSNTFDANTLGLSYSTIF